MNFGRKFENSFGRYLEDKELFELVVRLKKSKNYKDFLSWLWALRKAKIVVSETCKADKRNEV